MPNIIRNVGNLHDQTTGALTGYINPVTGKEEALNAAAIQGVVSGAWNRVDELGFPDPRRPAAVLGHFVLPGQTAQVLNTAPDSRLLAFTTNATNTNAGCSAASNAGRQTTTLAGATDAVGLRYADLGEPIPLTTITTGASAIALVVEIQE